jgi:type I restriction enzyme S subunit
VTDWPNVQMRRIARLSYGQSLADDARRPGVVEVFGSNGPVGSHDRANTRSPVVVVGRKGSFGKIQYSSRAVFAIDTTYFVDESQTKAVLRWLYYALSALGLDNLSVDVGVPGLSRERVYEQRVPYPPVATQRAIADYLDRETARIDAMMSSRQRQAVLLQEGLASQLMKLVDPSNKGVRQLPIARILQKQSRAASGVGVVTAFRNGLVSLRDRRRRDGFTESNTRSDYQGVKRGDVVFHGLDGFAGAIGVSEDNGICSPVYHVCATRQGFDSRYVALALRALALSGFLALQSGNVRERAVDFRNWDSLGRIQIPVPSLEEQRTRANAYIDRRNWTDTLVDGLRRQIALFQEHRQALIIAAVAGRLDIPELA